MSQYEHLGDRLDYAGRVYRRGELIELSEAEGECLIAAGLPLVIKTVSPDSQAEPEAPAEVKIDVTI